MTSVATHEAPDLILQTRALSKVFNGFVAVDGLDLNVTRGHVHALIGPNGAGKTTVFNLLTKFLRPSAGTILFNGEPITGERSDQTACRGIIRSFQISAVFGQMTALENVRVALQRRMGVSLHFWKSRRVLRDLDDRARSLLRSCGLADLADVPAAALPYGSKRALELATTLAPEPTLLLLDEPTQGMGREDVLHITELIRKVSVGKTVLMVEHNMDVVASIASHITVLQRGAILAEGDYASVSTDPIVMEAYMGQTDMVAQEACHE